MTTAASMTVTKLRRTGAGSLIDDGVVFKWDGPTHSSAIGVVAPRLEVKIVRKEMPGSNEVVHQAMSATWQPFSIYGEWRDIWMGQGEAYRAYLEFSRLVKAMSLVRVSLDTLQFVGMITELEFKYHHAAWIDWNFTLSPESNENIDAGALMGTGELVKQKSISQWIADTQASHDRIAAQLADSATIPLSTPDHEDVVNATGELDDAMDRLNEVGNSQTFLAGSPDAVSAIQSIGGDVTEIVWALPQAFERVRRAAFDVAFAVKDQRADLALAYDDFIQCLRFEQYVHDTTAACWRTIGISRDAAVDMRSRSSQRARAIYRARAGESLERISTKFYGTPDNANLIYRANHLSSIVLNGTEELIIPEIGA